MPAKFTKSGLNRGLVSKAPAHFRGSVPCPGRVSWAAQLCLVGRPKPPFSWGVPGRRQAVEQPGWIVIRNHDVTSFATDEVVLDGTLDHRKQRIVEAVDIQQSASFSM